MYKQIKQLADEAIALQNKNRMDEVLREISGIAWAESMKTCFEDKRVEELQRQLETKDGAALIGFDVGAENGAPSDEASRQLADADALTSSTNFGGRKIEGESKFEPGKKPTAKKGGAK